MTRPDFGWDAFTPDPSWPSIIELAIERWGKPTSRKPDEFRFGSQGSKSVEPSSNTWFDHEANEGGGYVEMHRAVRGELPKRTNGHDPAGGIAATYDYTDADGGLLFQVVRKVPKQFVQRRPDGKGGWVWKLGDIERVLYRLPALRSAPPDAIIWLCEGEKDADNLAKRSLVATTNPGGTGKWRDAYNAEFAGSHVVILPDNDPQATDKDGKPLWHKDGRPKLPGQDHAAYVATKLHGIAASVRVLPDLPPKGDVSDWLEAGNTVGELERLARDAPEVGDRNLSDQTPHDHGADTPPELHGCPLTEDGAAQAFAIAHGDDLRFCHGPNRWHHWDGSRWKIEQTRLAFSWVRDIARRMGTNTRKASLRATLGRASFATGVERFAQSDRAFAVTSDRWDQDPWLLGTPGGTIDLRTGILRPASREAFISRQTSVTPAATADCPRWLRFLDEATCGDALLVTFLQRWFGYSLTGDTREEALLFGHGTGGNGKGVLLHAVFTILGDYAVNAAIDAFTVTPHDKHTTDVAMLAGARMVIATEIEEGRAWAEARIKALTGRDPITARFVKRDNFTFIPTFKLTISGNHKPSLRNVDDAAKRRFNIVPFLHKPAVVDKNLPDDLRSEYPAILRWLIEGCIAWQQEGLMRSKVVKNATDEYFEAQDHFGRWLAECCTLDPGLSAKPSALLHSFQSWCKENGEEGTDNKRLRGMIERTHGLRYVTNYGSQLVRGIALNPPPQDDRWG